VTLQIEGPLTDDTIVVNYDHSMFIAHTTGVLYVSIRPER